MQGRIFDIEKVVGHSTKHGKTKYLVRFFGLNSDEDVWVNSEQIRNKEIIEKYFEHVPDGLNEYIYNDYSYAINDVLNLEQLRFKTPKRVIGAYNRNEKLYYRVEFAREKFYSVESDILKMVFPTLIVNFLENKIMLNKDV